MMRTIIASRWQYATRPIISVRAYSKAALKPPAIQIKDGTFYRSHPNAVHAKSSSNPVLFERLNFILESSYSESETPRYVAVIGPSSSGKTTLLQVLQGHHICIPPAARSWPLLEPGPDRKSQTKARAIKYVGFDGEQGLGGSAPKGAYLSARYESRREDTDFSVLDYLQGNTELNPLKDSDGLEIDAERLARVIKDLRLDDLVDMPVSNLSNGQTRRARIARALLGNPEVLLLDEPFMGLDPPTLLTLSPLLHRMAQAGKPRVVLALRPQDPIPDWISHLYYLDGNCHVAWAGPKEDVLSNLRRYVEDVKEGRRTSKGSHLPIHAMQEVGRTLTSHGIIEPETSSTTNGDVTFDVQRSQAEGGRITSSTPGEALVEMEGARVRYGSKTVLGNWQQQVDGQSKDGLWWTIRRGERWGIFGPNGSGKTTILSLICSDHPQTYSLPIKLFGRSRLPEPGQLGISIFDIQARIGHSSPEIHNHMPRSLTIRQVLENAYSETFKGIPQLNDDARTRIDACLRWFQEDLNPASQYHVSSDIQADSSLRWAEDILFGGLPFSGQRVALFLRAVLKQSDLIILDEAFSGMDDGVRDRCLLFLTHGETKQFKSTPASTKAGIHGAQERVVIESEVSKAGNVKVGGLSENQALLCISHVREEIPSCVREWICLPEANEGKPARFGRLTRPLDGDHQGWKDIWGLSSAS